MTYIKKQAVIPRIANADKVTVIVHPFIYKGPSTIMRVKNIHGATIISYDLATRVGDETANGFVYQLEQAGFVAQHYNANVDYAKIDRPLVRIRGEVKDVKIDDQIHMVFRVSGSTTVESNIQDKNQQPLYKGTGQGFNSQMAPIAFIFGVWLDPTLTGKVGNTASQTLTNAVNDICRKPEMHTMLQELVTASVGPKPTP